MPDQSRKPLSAQDLRKLLQTYSLLLNTLKQRLREVPPEVHLSSRLRAFMDGKRALRDGLVLDEAIKAIDDDDLGGQIIASQVDLSDRFIAATKYPASIQEAFIDLLEAYEPYREKLTISSFARIFNEYAQAVEDTLRSKDKGFEALVSQHVRDGITEMLVGDHFNECVQAVVSQEFETRQRLAIELQVLLGQLEPQYGKSQARVAPALGISYSTLSYMLAGKGTIHTIEHTIDRAKQLIHNTERPYSKVEADKPLLRGIDELKEVVAVLEPYYDTKPSLYFELGVAPSTFSDLKRGKGSQKRLDELIKKAHELIASTVPQGGSGDAMATSEPILVTAPPQESVNTSVRVHELGETTADGVQYVLTEASFRHLVTPPLLDLVNTLFASFESTRLLLGVIAQLKDEESRKYVMNDPRIKRELRELKLVLELLRSADPQNRLGLHDAGRDFQTNLQERNGDFS